MAHVLARKVPDCIAAALRKRAARARRTLGGELSALMDGLHPSADDEPTRVAAEWRERLAVGWTTDSTLIIRQDRDTDHGREAFHYTSEQFREAILSYRERYATHPVEDSVAILRRFRDAGLEG